MTDLGTDKVGEKIILLGNYAIVRGCLESGVGFASTYPGTPSSEVGDGFVEIAKDFGIYFEYSSNEKVALEAAAGAALSGVKSICFFKHFGLNVAAESVFPLAYVGVKAPMVIMVADDPQCWSSGQSEEDTRRFARIAHLPMLEPCDAQECKDFVIEAFKISEEIKLPVFVRTTTRVGHMRGVVETGPLVKPVTRGKFIKDIAMKNFPPHIVKTHEELHVKLKKIESMSDKSKLNFIVNKGASKDLGVIVSGVSYNYVIDSMDRLGIKLPVLKLGFTFPTPDEKIKKFIKKLKRVLIVEELESILEEKVQYLAKEVNPDIKILGKSHFPQAGEYKVETVLETLKEITKSKFSLNLKEHKKKVEKIKIPRRFPVLCAGCPHRATFYAAKEATKGMNVVYGGDVGCYILGIFKPLEMQDFMFCMGASIGVTHGINKVSDQKTIAFVGDSTFFHAGMPGVVNTVFNKSNSLIIVMDNRITAMTGHQPNPGMGRTGLGEETVAIDIETLVKGMGVKNTKTIDPYNVKEMIKTIKEFLKKDSVSVIVAKRECQLLAVKKKRAKGLKIPRYTIVEGKQREVKENIEKWNCPAIVLDKGEFRIDRNVCTGCGLCVGVFPKGTMKVVVE
jgi:indolepyruvate ferredoxin oxidoreductase alpha subunit